METQRGFVPVDEHMRVIDATGKLVSHVFLQLLMIFGLDNMCLEQIIVYTTNDGATSDNK